MGSDGSAILVRESEARESLKWLAEQSFRIFRSFIFKSFYVFLYACSLSLTYLSKSH